jgi:hypothetical protein
VQAVHNAAHPAGQIYHVTLLFFSWTPLAENIDMTGRNVEKKAL